jgi:hypothetical protein
MASATTATSGPRHSTSAPQARGRHGLRCDAEGSQGAETVSEAPELSHRFSHQRSRTRIHSPSLLHIGAAAYFVWARPPSVGGTAPRHGQGHSHTTSSIKTSKQLLLNNWLRVLGTAESSQVDQHVCQQLHAIVPLLDAFKAEQQPFKLIFPRKGPLDTHA